MLASIQYFFIRNNFLENTHDIKHVIFFLGVLIGVILGNFLIKFINEKKLKLSVEIFSRINCIYFIFQRIKFYLGINLFKVKNYQDLIFAIIKSIH